MGKKRQHREQNRVYYKQPVLLESVMKTLHYEECTDQQTQQTRSVTNRERLLQLFQVYFAAVGSEWMLCQQTRKVYVDLYSALRKAPLMRSDMDHEVLPANYTMPAFTPQPQSITALWLVLVYRPTEG